MKLKDACIPRQSVFAKDRRDIVLDLADLFEDNIDADKFFEENFVTSGMNMLLEKTLDRLLNNNDQASTFLLTQAMGGGKTHNMIALGLLAKHPELRVKYNVSSNLDSIRVVGFNGRQSDAPLGIWGEIANQLGKKDQFSEYYSPLQAPGPQAWINLLKGEPTLILLDELPPYMENALSKEIGASNLASVTTTALSNLLVAANKAELTNVCVVISDLTASYEGGSDNINKALDNLQNETNRSALPIEPVSQSGDEIYHILRTRLFEKLPDDDVIKSVANEYGEAVKKAKQMDITRVSADSFVAQLIDSYPFHFSMRDLYGRFKENPGFQQTRGLIRLMRMVVSNLYNTDRADEIQLISPYDLDLNDDEILSEIKAINPSLSEAITHDIAKDGYSVAEELGKKYNNRDAQDVATLLLVSSLANIPNATHGLRESDIVGFICAPGRDISTIKKDVIDYLPTQAWYLHTSQDGRYFFKNTQNLAAKLHSLANSYNEQSSLKELRDFLKHQFSPSLKDCYQKLEVLPAIDEVDIEADKTLLILTEPTNVDLAPSKLHKDWDAFANDAQYKNRLLFLSGSHETLARVKDQARQYKAIQSIIAEFDSERLSKKDPQYVDATRQLDIIQLRLRSAIQETFTTLVYPSKGGLRSTDCRIDFKDNQFDGESLIRDTLKKLHKFTHDITSDSFRKKCEARLFGGQQTAPWSEIKRRAATNVEWPLHRTDALEALKSECLSRDVWRDKGGIIDKGPFPPPATQISVQKLNRDNDTGEATLKITPMYGDTVYFEEGDNLPTTASSNVSDASGGFSGFKTRELKLNFICVDSTGEHQQGAPFLWENTINLKYSVYQQGDDWMVELHAIPQGAIMYSTDGSHPKQSSTPYHAPFVVPDDSQLVLAFAQAAGIESEIARIPINQYRTKKIEIKRDLPVTWKRRHKDLTGKQAFDLLDRLKKFNGVAKGIIIDVRANNEQQDINYTGADDFTLDGESFEKTVKHLQSLTEGSQIFLNVASIHFEKGQDLLDWIADMKGSLKPGETVQVET